LQEITLGTDGYKKAGSGDGTKLLLIGGAMKRIILLAISIIMLASVAISADLNLRATWTANTEPDMASYRLYRTDGTRSLIGTISHPTTQYDFTITVPDRSEGRLRFVLTAVDTSNNESGDSNEANYPFDFAPPAVPGGFNIQKRQ